VAAKNYDLFFKKLFSNNYSYGPQHARPELNKKRVTTFEGFNLGPMFKKSSEYKTSIKLYLFQVTFYMRS